MHPLCVDLDGTLIRTDLLWESAFALLKSNPLQALWMPVWLVMGGRAGLKRKIVERVKLDPSTLPYNTHVMDFLTKEKARGRSLILATASDEGYARMIASHLGFFDQVIGSDGRSNLSGAQKLSRIQTLLANKPFAYAGNSSADLPIWKEAAEAVAVNAPRGVLRTLRADVGPRLTHVFTSQGGVGKALFKALRIHQWSKNLLLFLPLVFAHKVSDHALAIDALIAFLSFSLCASSVYVLNDLFDLESDRHHAKKKHRPFASGALPLQWGIALVPVFLFAGTALARSLTPDFLKILAFYYFCTLAYSTWIKRLLLGDVILLATLYTIRIFAGAIATQVPLSHWLLVFSMFFFLSLAMVKRVSELHELILSNTRLTRGRGYQIEDKNQLASLGGASGYIAVLVLALYITSKEVMALYPHPERLWLICPVVFYWISRVWVLAHRGRLHEDPVVFALKDRASYVAGAIAAVAVIAAAYN